MSSEAPEGWRLTKLGEIAGLSGGTTPSKAKDAYWANGSVPWATPSDITSLPLGQTRIAGTETHITELALKECSLRLNAPGTVLMTSRATIGHAAINDVPMTTNQGFLTLTCSEDSDPDFLCQWLNANRSALTAAAGGSTFKELSRGTAKLLPILLPPLDEQRRIAEVLRSVDEAIEAQDKVCRQLSAAFTGALEACFSAAEWPSYHLGDLCQSIQVGIVVKPAAYYVESGGVPALRSLNVLENRLALDDLVYISEAGHQANQKSSLRAGDVVTRRTGEPGKTAMIPSGFEAGLNCIDIIFSRPKDCLRSAYLSFFMNSKAAKRQVAGLQGGLAQQHLNVGEMKKLMLPLPDLRVQDQTVEVLDDMWASLESSRHSLLKLSALRANLAADLLSGRVRVPA
ncbi:restriction endonuclease subunit S [Brevundimonas sp. A19_0]|uniref:restriction endonuclease subunit S n=1 Tax=Brevundimonas sp. A19_0 TaxID=2821087 RepID=UPI001AD9BED3|nr:restriction endonuclease subunit S [Brevundimonas sp. A19_0]MBO9502914.1 restriction endonuclease subunit S [Brevundimonas sp. A19_0]